MGWKDGWGTPKPHHHGVTRYSKSTQEVVVKETKREKDLGGRTSESSPGGECHRYRRESITRNFRDGRRERLSILDGKWPLKDTWPETRFTGSTLYTSHHGFGTRTSSVCESLGRKSRNHLYSGTRPVCGETRSQRMWNLTPIVTYYKNTPTSLNWVRVMNIITDRGHKLFKIVKISRENSERRSEIPFRHNHRDKCLLFWLQVSPTLSHVRRQVVNETMSRYFYHCRLGIWFTVSVRNLSTPLKTLGREIIGVI